MAQGSPVAAILEANTSTPVVQFSQGRGVYTFVLTVTYSTGATARDAVTIDYQATKIQWCVRNVSRRLRHSQTAKIYILHVSYTLNKELSFLPTDPRCQPVVVLS